MDESTTETLIALSAACADAVEAYREFGRHIQSPAIRKMLESVIHQKSEHVAKLGGLDPAGRSTARRLVRPTDGYPEAALSSLVEHERAFAEALDALAARLESEEARVGAKALAEAGRKFAGWAQDHLDLLAMF